MKKLFLFLRARITPLNSIRWVDLDKGQLNKYDTRPSIDFPAVLLKVEYPNTTKLSGPLQQCNAIVTATVVFDFMDDTSSITEEQTLMQSLECYDIADEVHKLVQGAMDVNVIRTPLDRLSVRDPNRPDKIKTLIYTYGTKVHE